MTDQNTNSQAPLSHEELRKLTEKELLEMFCEGKSDQERRNRQAAHELGRRREARESRVQLTFVILATLAALASAVAAVVSTFYQ